MNAWDGLRPLAFIAGLLTAALLIISGLVSADAAKLINPSPEGIAEQLVGAMGAHRYEGATNQLSSELKQQVEKKDLQAIMENLEKSPRKGIQDAHGQDAQTEGDQATASVEITFGNNQKQTVDLPLKKENGIWRITSLNALQALAQNNP